MCPSPFGFQTQRDGILRKRYDVTPVPDLWVVLSGCDAVYLKSATYCHEEYQQEWRAIVSEGLARDTIVCDRVLKEGTSYCDGAGSFARVVLVSFV